MLTFREFVIRTLNDERKNDLKVNINFHFPCLLHSWISSCCMHFTPYEHYNEYHWLKLYSRCNIIGYACNMLEQSRSYYNQLIQCGMHN